MVELTLRITQRELYRQDANGAKKIAKGVIAEDRAGDTAEIEALTMTANVLLNLDEMPTKE